MHTHKEILRYKSNDMQILKAENYNTLLKVIKDDFKKWRENTVFIDQKIQYC